ncbi:predicted S-transferase [Carnobacterium sp. AT7]|nr:predicted S-transferase [Carnobacterium sp. AT7]
MKTNKDGEEPWLNDGLSSSFSAGTDINHLGI